MKQLKPLPESEFEIMKVVWDCSPPATSAVIMEKLGKRKGWKSPTITAFMNRLVERGYLNTEKNGKERHYYPLVTREEYLEMETSHFFEQYHDNSFFSFMNALYGGKKIKDEELDALLKWAEERKE